MHAALTRSMTQPHTFIQNLPIYLTSSRSASKHNESYNPIPAVKTMHAWDLQLASQETPSSFLVIDQWRVMVMGASQHIEGPGCLMSATQGFRNNRRPWVEPLCRSCQLSHKQTNDNAGQSTLTAKTQNLQLCCWYNWPHYAATD
jgi:hypothetical protein